MLRGLLKLNLTPPPSCSCEHRLSFAKLSDHNDFVSRKDKIFLIILASCIFLVVLGTVLVNLPWWQKKNVADDIICGTWTMGTSITVVPYKVWAPHPLTSRNHRTFDAHDLWSNHKTSVATTVLVIDWPTLNCIAEDVCKLHVHSYNLEHSGNLPLQ